MYSLRIAPGSGVNAPSGDAPGLPARAAKVGTAMSWLLLAMWAIGSLGALWWLEWQESPLNSLCSTAISPE